MRVAVGNRYGMLTVIGLISHPKNPKALCACDCGKQCTPQRGSLVNGHSTSCGCAKVRAFVDRNSTHKRSKTRAYSRWSNIQDRCRNPKNKHFHNYGGRGISVEWDSFESFYADMGEPPTGHWLERKNNDGNYSKANCEWSLPRENQINKRVSKWWLVNGTRYESSVAAARALGVHSSQVNRNCNGFTKNGKYHPPKAGWSCELKYGEPDVPKP